MAEAEGAAARRQQQRGGAQANPQPTPSGGAASHARGIEIVRMSGHRIVLPMEGVSGAKQASLSRKAEPSTPVGDNPRIPALSGVDSVIEFLGGLNDPAAAC
jgi:hypothetical protein